MAGRSNSFKNLNEAICATLSLKNALKIKTKEEKKVSKKENKE